MQVSKNIWRGGLITDLNELPKLAEQRKSVVLTLGGKVNFVRPAAFILQWSLAMVLNHKIYYAVKNSDIADVEFDEPISKYKFDIDRPDFYLFDKPELKERTKKRLIEIAELGMEEVMTADFGYPKIMSGLYIEYVWHYSDKDFKSYMDWVRELIDKKINNSNTK